MLLRGESHKLSAKINRIAFSVVFAFLPLFAIALIVYVLHAGFGTDLKPVEAAVGVNKMISYQAKMTDAAGVTVPNGTYYVTLRIYDSASGGTCLYTASGTSCGAATSTPVTVTNGILSVMIGDTASQNALTLDFNSDTYYLGVQINNDSEMTPRKRIGAAGYAINSDTLDGYNTSLTGGSTSFVPVTTPGGDLIITGRLLSSSTLYLTTTSTGYTPNVQFSATGTFFATPTDKSGNSAYVLDTTGVLATSSLVSVRNNNTEVFGIAADGSVKTSSAMRDAFGWSTANKNITQTVLGQGAAGGWGNSISAGGNFYATSSWTAFDLQSINTDFEGFNHGVFDGRYIYLIGENIIRYDTTRKLEATSSYSNINIYNIPVVTGDDWFEAGVFDGRYIYFVSDDDNVVRYDTQSGFNDYSSWSSFHLNNLSGCSGDACTTGISALFDGRYVYVVSQDNATVARYDTASAFSSAGSWSTYGMWNNPGLHTGSLTGAVYDGRFIYFTQEYQVHLDDFIIRYDTSGTFFATSSWSDFGGSGSVHEGMGAAGERDYNGGAFDGRYVYFSPGCAHNYFGGCARLDEVLRYDTVSNFSATSSWVLNGSEDADGGNPGSFEGAVYDGRYIYYAPNKSGTQITSPNGVAMRYDTTKSLNDVSSWSNKDVSNITNVSDTTGFDGAVYDGRYVYFVPRDNGVYNGKLLRYDTQSPEQQYGISQVARSKELFIDSSENIGIGTMVSLTKLTVQGDAITLGDGLATSTWGVSTSTYIYAHPARDLAGYSAFTINTTSTLANAGLFTVRNNGASVLNVGPSTSTFSGGIQINSGCFLFNGSCLSMSGGSLPAGTTNYTLRYDGANWASDGNLINTGTNVGVATTSPVAGFTVASGAVLFDGTTGATPYSGVGTRTMWVPAKGAFRAGIVDASGYFSGAEWDDANIGTYSFAAGRDTAATGYGSIALGGLTTASNFYSVALGQQNSASGNAALSTGSLTTASGYASTAMGAFSDATGWVSTALGRYSNANGRFSTGIGYYAYTTSSAAMALGSDVSATGASSTAIGTFASSTAQNSIVIGSGVDINTPLVNATANSLAMGFASTTPTLLVEDGRITASGTLAVRNTGTSTISGKLDVGSVGSPARPLFHVDSDTGEVMIATSTNPFRPLGLPVRLTIDNAAQAATGLVIIGNGGSNVPDLYVSNGTDTNTNKTVSISTGDGNNSLMNMNGRFNDTARTGAQRAVDVSATNNSSRGNGNFDFYGINSFATNSSTRQVNNIYGIVGQAQLNGTSAATSTYGGYFAATTDSGYTSSSTNFYGVYGRANVNAGTVSNVYAGYFDASGGSGSTAYGIYAKSTNGTNNYAAFLDGKIYIGVDTPPAPASYANTLYNNAGNLYWNGNQIPMSGLPSGSTNQTLRYSGSAWVATSGLAVDAAGNTTSTGVFAASGTGTSTISGRLDVSDKVTVNNAVLFNGLVGNTPISGAGTRLMWIPNKAAFRAGQLTSGNDDKWDDANIGLNSFAANYNTSATGSVSAAFGGNNDAGGAYSFVTGNLSGAYGANSVAMGYNSIALGRQGSGFGSVAIGNQASSTEESAYAIGAYVTASAANSAVFGSASKALAQGALALGYGATALGQFSFAEGQNSLTTSTYGTAIGYGTEAGGLGAFAGGYSTHAYAANSVALGYNSYARGASAVAIGEAASANANNAVAIGYNSSATNTYAVAIGYTATAGGNGSFAGGFLASAYGSTSMALGYNVAARGNSSFASGDSTNANGSWSFVGGQNSTADGQYSFAFGNNSSATGSSAVAFGANSTKAGGLASFAAGSGAAAYGDYSVSFGGIANGVNSLAIDGGTANGSNSFAFGSSAYADGVSSIAWGYNSTSATNTMSMALGVSVSSGGLASFAVGTGALAYGNYSIAMGGGNPTARGQYSVAIGGSVEANGTNALALGYNVKATGNNSVAVGIGSGYNGEVTKNNSFAILGGNVGIASSSPAYLLSMESGNDGGYYDSGLHQWASPSTRGVKQDISDLTVGERENVLSMLDNLAVSKYHFKTDAAAYGDEAIWQYGIMVDESPNLFGGHNRDAMQLGSTVQFLLTAAQSMNLKIKALEQGWRVSTSTLQLFTSSTIFSDNTGTSTFAGNLAVGGTITQECGEGCVDIAETFNSSELVEAGDVVSITDNQLSITNDVTVEKTKVGYAHNVVGIVSTNPAITLNGDQTIIGTSGVSETMSPPVALAGRVPVKVTDENGPVKAGDLLVSSSSTPGAAMKYDPDLKFKIQNSKFPAVIGMALTDFDYSVGQTGLEPEKNKEFQIEVYSVTGETGIQTVHQGKVLTLIKNNYIQPSGIGIDGLGLSVSDDGKILSTRELDLGNNAISNVKSIISASGNWSIDESGYIKAKTVEAEEFVVNNDSGDATVGIGHFNGGQKEVLIENSRVKKSSKIFVSFLGNPGGTSWISETQDGWFKVELSVPAISDVDFNYWILGVTNAQTPMTNDQLPITLDSVEPVMAAETEPEISSSTPEIIEPEVPPAETATTTP